jgi:3-deoxy-D-manno-octulosonate 8-phosphate phosphatase (KDO 8-P phosphatase)
VSPDAARRIELVVLDVDGVLTDGGLYLAESESGAITGLRRFHVHDGIGVYMLHHAGIDVSLVSAKRSAAVRERARQLRIGEVHQVHWEGKVEAVAGMLRARGLAWENVACLADDLADLAVLERAGLPAAVANAVPEVRRLAAWQGTVPGGSGAVREFSEALLRARGEWDDLVERYVRRGRGERPE